MGPVWGLGVLDLDLHHYCCVLGVSLVISSLWSYSCAQSKGAHMSLVYTA